ncbi:MAG: M48 family metalloprotease [Holosporaceae bacterium]|jgi:predicted Zn-dependent protease|nr:M48 family metalloprotease [Holosporaceae bacterium]
MKFLRITLVCVSVITTNFSSDAMRIVRDAEIEEILTEMAKSIFKVAGLRAESAKIYVINSEAINAFTIGNGYIFINSGLLLKFYNPLHLLSILCHETGHIAAGHINQQISAIQQRSKNFTLAMLAGILGSVVAGSQEAIAILMGYAMADERFYLRFSRVEEFAADALAATYLEKLGYGSDVLIDTFNVFKRIEILNGEANLPIYVRTHPRTDSRISAIQKRAQSKAYKADPELSKKYNRVLVKLRSYLKRLNIGTAVPNDDYSKAIYLHRIGRSTEAINLLQKLCDANPRDVYYKETLAQTLYESGRLDESIQIYEKIYNHNVNILIKIDYANVLMEANKKIDFAISMLESSKYIERFNADIYRLLAKGYGKQNKEGLSLLTLAQEQILLQNYRVAHELLINCLKKLNPKTEASSMKKAKYFKELLERDYEKHIK